MDGLGRINLLVGPNNCGKSTVLEAIDLLADYPDPVTVGFLCFGRGGFVSGESTNSQNNTRIAIRHMFYGRQAKPGSFFEIDANAEERKNSLRVSITTAAKSEESEGTASPISGRLILQFSKTLGPESIRHSIPLTHQSEWPFAEFDKRYDEVNENCNENFVTTDSHPRHSIVKNLARVSLNPEEEFVLKVLRILEPRIVGITAVPLVKTEFHEGRNGVFVKLTGEPERVPIASLGDGIWRLLGLALALVRARGSVLLVDEIDIGLHYTAQVDMWRMVKGAAEQLDVQVFATTHSSDCIRALASLARSDVTTGSEITIQRIEGERAVAYNEREIVLAAERGIEVR